MAARRCYRHNMCAAHRAARPGFIRLAIERCGYDPREITRRVVAIAATLTRMFECARERNIATNRAANELVEERLEAAA